jgi:hypothetical protein
VPLRRTERRRELLQFIQIIPFDNHVGLCWDVDDFSGGDEIGVRDGGVRRKDQGKLNAVAHGNVEQCITRLN